MDDDFNAIYCPFDGSVCDNVSNCNSCKAQSEPAPEPQVIRSSYNGHGVGCRCIACDVMEDFN